MISKQEKYLEQVDVMALGRRPTEVLGGRNGEGSSGTSSPQVLL